MRHKYYLIDLPFGLGTRIDTLYNTFKNKKRTANKTPLPYIYINEM